MCFLYEAKVRVLVDALPIRSDSVSHPRELPAQIGGP